VRVKREDEKERVREREIDGKTASLRAEHGSKKSVCAPMLSAAAAAAAATATADKKCFISLPLPINRIPPDLFSKSPRNFPSELFKTREARRRRSCPRRRR
jgi:hypothetical protein